MSISEQIREYLDQHPQQSLPLPLGSEGALTFHVTADGAVSVEAIDGDQFQIPLDYLDLRRLTNLTFADGIVTVELPAGTRHYRPVCLCDFERSVLCTRTIPFGGTP